MDEVFVIVRSTGDASYQDETPIRFVLTEEEAKAAIERALLEQQTIPHPEDEPEYAWRGADGHWFEPGERVFHGEHGEPTWAERPEGSAVIVARNNERHLAHVAHCRSLNCVDPDGTQSDADYHYARVTLYSASGIEAFGRDRETGRDAKHESPAPKGDAPTQSGDTSEEEK